MRFKVIRVKSLLNEFHAFQLIMLCCGAVLAYKFAVTSIVTLECLINGGTGGGIFEKSINGGLNKRRGISW